MGFNNTELNLSLCQVSSTKSLSDNLEKAETLLAESQSKASDLVVFPENVLSRGSYEDIRSDGHTEDFFVEKLGELSKTYGLNVVWGGLPVEYAGELFNVAMVFDRSGQLTAAYRKIHLFKLDLGIKAVDEASLFTAGSIPVKFQLHDWNIGLTICYDLRFPELYRCYAGAGLILCTSDFTHYTGKAHWTALLRARAIENQCFIVGVNQCGLNVGMNVKSYGHSMVVDPWGKELEAAKDEEVCIHCKIHREALNRVRTHLPALSSIQHRVRW